MKKKTQKFDVEFYINPKYNYKEHKINILKECLVEWTKREKFKFCPFKPNEFTYNIESVEKEGTKVIVFHCHTTYEWINSHNMFAEINGLTSFFE